MPKPLTVADYRLAARRYLPRAVFDYVDGAAGDERGLARNREAIERILFAPRPLRDVSRRDASIEIFGRRQEMPIVVGPVGLPGSVRPGADLALARAAKRAGVPFALSTAASASIEEVRAASDGDLWFQLYVLNRGLADSLVKRALAADYSTLVLTVDTAVGGRRERDTRNGFGIPFRMTPRFFTDCALHPAWAISQLRNGLPEFGNLKSAEASDTNQQAMLMLRQIDASYAWDDLKALRDAWPRKLVVKGLMHQDDARRCFEIGVDGVGFSNHGGRQVEDSRAPIDLLAEATAPEGRTLFVDSGFRRGADIVKAVALGASAVFLGRVPLFALGARGEDGVDEMLAYLRAEIENTLALIGCPNARDLSREVFA